MSEWSTSTEESRLQLAGKASTQSSEGSQETDRDWIASARRASWYYELPKTAPISSLLAKSTELPVRDNDWSTLIHPYKPALARWVDPKRLGGALLITASCDDIQDRPEMFGFDALYTNPDLLVPGGAWRMESKEYYRDQALLGVELIEDGLEQIGVPRERIFHVDFTEGDSSGPRDEVQSLIRRMPHNAPDVLIYYSGPSVAGGAWALSWRVPGDIEDVLVTPFLDPQDLQPEPGLEDGPPGLRLVVVDAPDSARMWMRPAMRLIGLAAWEGEGQPGGPGGPPLARWLAGKMPKPPEGVVTFELPPDADLRRIPAYKALFWGPPMESKLAGRLLWELQQFVGASTRREQQESSATELLAFGGPQLLLMLLYVHNAAEEALLLQIIWLLHHLVLYAPVERWVGTADEALADVLAAPANRTDPSAGLLAAVLGFAAAAASRCTLCRSECTGQRWPEVRALVLRALQEPREAGAVAAACRVVSQVGSRRSLGEDTTLLDALLRALLAAAAETRQVAAEALLFATLKCDAAKRRALATLGQRLPAMLEGSAPAAVAALLSLLRSVAAGGSVQASVGGEVVDSVVHCLCSHAGDAAVQRWGLAALGALASADDSLAERAAEGGALCVVWALGADALARSAAVEQEALFCAHALCGTAAGRARLASPESHVAGLVAGAVARSARRGGGGGSEAGVWGLRFFERLARGKETLPVVERYVTTIIDAMRVPDCHVGAATAGAGALSLVLQGSDTAKERIMNRRVEVVKSLHTRARAVAVAGDERAQRQEKDLNDWAHVLIRLLEFDDESKVEPVVRAEDVAEKEEVFPYELELKAAKKKKRGGKRDKKEKKEEKEKK